MPYALFVVRVAAGLLFWQHGLEKLFGFAGAHPEASLVSIRGIAGILEAVGGPLLVVGLCTRPTAFILSGEMAVAYFRAWAPRGIFPIANGGEEATLNAFIFLWIAAAGAGAWSLDALLQKDRAPRALRQRAADLEPHARALLRLVVGLLLTLHGVRKIFDVLPSIAGRVGAPPLALDSLPAVTGALEIVAGPLLMAGLFVRQAAWIVAAEAVVAYLVVAQPRALWPIRNGGIEALLYAAVMLYFVVAGPGPWSLDSRRSSEASASRRAASASADPPT